MKQEPLKMLLEWGINDSSMKMKGVIMMFRN